jgi:hypothetical protein
VLCIPASGTLFRNAAGHHHPGTLDGPCGIPHFRLSDYSFTRARSVLNSIAESHPPDGSWNHGITSGQSRKCSIELMCT